MQTENRHEGHADENPDRRGVRQASGAAPADLDTLSVRVLLRLLTARLWDGARSGFLWCRRKAEQATANLHRLRAATPLYLHRDFAKIGRGAAAGLVWWKARATDLARRLPARRRRWVALLVLLPVLYLIYCAATIPWAAGPAAQATSGALIVEADGGRPVATRGILKGEPISAEHIPQPLANAVTAIEDRRFYQHGALDLRAIVRAAWHDLFGRRLEGASTISQQLARLRYLSSERSVRRKVQEALIALWLEARLRKQEILAQYLSRAYFGYGAYGADAAARRYFSKTPAQLSLGEAAMLAGLIRAPSALEPDRYLYRARQRASEVLDAMVATGFVSEQDANAARQHPAVLRVAADPPSGSNYFLDTVAAEVKARVGTNGSDLVVRTTFDPALQRLAEDSIKRRLAGAERAKNVEQAALVAMMPTGAILALVGGKNFPESQFNRVTQARRQPGSLFKVFVYLAALRNGFGPDSIVVDRPVRVGDWEPENYGARYFGPVTLRTAFAHSLNSVAVQLAETVGINQVIEAAKRLGIHSDLPAVPSVALGSGTVTLLDMTSAFAAVSVNTTSVEPFTVRSISAGGDHQLYTKAAVKAAPADNPPIHAAMLDLLASTVREGTARAASWDGPAAGKTGTSQDYRDAWFVGFTPDLVVGVWVGNDDNSPMNGVTGGSIPAGIWHDFVSRAEKLYRSGHQVVPAQTGSPVADPLSLANTGEPRAALGSTQLRGRLRVLRDGTLELQQQPIRLAGVEQVDRYSARLIRRLVRRRDAVCTPTGDDDVYNCRIGDVDLSSLILLNRGLPGSAEMGAERSAPNDDGRFGFFPQRPRSRRSFWFFRW